MEHPHCFLLGAFKSKNPILLTVAGRGRGASKQFSGSIKQKLTRPIWPQVPGTRLANFLRAFPKRRHVRRVEVSCESDLIWLKQEQDGRTLALSHLSFNKYYLLIISFPNPKYWSTLTRVSNYDKRYWAIGGPQLSEWELRNKIQQMRVHLLFHALSMTGVPGRFQRRKKVDFFWIRAAGRAASWAHSACSYMAAFALPPFSRR